MEPIFARGTLYDDAVSALQETRSRDLKTAIVSNTPWGSPAGLWREEVERLGLGELAEVVVFCRDVGWRKPAKQVFLHTLEQLGAQRDCCLFVGDDPRWDVVGPESIGIKAVLINRQGTPSPGGKGAIKTLNQIWDRP
jgi:putative hydrolase of the HAD superfamily